MHDLELYKRRTDVIVANRWNNELDTLQIRRTLRIRLGETGSVARKVRTLKVFMRFPSWSIRTRFDYGHEH